MRVRSSIPCTTLVARSTYPRLGFPSYPGEVHHAEDTTAEQKAAARNAAEAAIAEPLEVFRKYFVRDGFIGDGSTPSIADIRFAATLEFLALQDKPLPQWAKDYVQRVEAKLGEGGMGMGVIPIWGGVEANPSPVGRPLWTAHLRSTERGHLDRVPSFTIRNPEFTSA